MNTYNIIVLVSALVVLGLSIWAFMTRCNIDKFGDNLPDCVDADKFYSLKSNMCTLENIRIDNPEAECDNYTLESLDSGSTCKLKPCCNVDCSMTGGRVGIDCNSGDCHGDMRNPVNCNLSDCKDCDFNNPYSLDQNCETCCNYLKKQ